MKLVRKRRQIVHDFFFLAEPSRRIRAPRSRQWLLPAFGSQLLTAADFSFPSLCSFITLWTLALPLEDVDRFVAMYARKCNLLSSAKQARYDGLHLDAVHL